MVKKSVRMSKMQGSVRENLLKDVILFNTIGIGTGCRSSGKGEYGASQSGLGIYAYASQPLFLVDFFLMQGCDLMVKCLHKPLATLEIETRFYNTPGPLSHVFR